jgi:CheY-like chemotaxis protein
MDAVRQSEQHLEMISVLMDINVPKMSGVDATAHIKGAARDQMVVLRLRSMTVSGGPRDVDDLSGGFSSRNHIGEHRAVGVLHQGLECRELRRRHAGEGRQRHEIFAVPAGNVRSKILV